MRRFSTVLLTSLCTSLFAATPAIAQPGPSADRIATGIAIRPLVTGGQRVDAVVHIRTDDNFSVPTSVATDLVLLVNGTAAVPPTALDYFASDCSGSADCPLGQTCLCDADGNCNCEGNAITIPYDVFLVPGDVVEVQLFVGAGGLPETDPTNNTRSVAYQGDPILWDRRIVGAELVPAPGGPDVFDIVLDAEIAANLDGLQALGAEILVLIDGAPAGPFPGPFPDDLSWFFCATVACDDTVACVMDAAGEFFGSCQPSGGIPACQCLYHPVPDVIPGVIIPAGTGEVEVILRPVPGALPELPPLPGEPPTDNDQLTLPVPSPCPADLDEDGNVGLSDLLTILASWGPCAGCPADIDGNDNVGLSDLLSVLAAWGPCAP